MVNTSTFYKDRVILVAGGVGSIGSQLVKKLVELDTKVVRVLDNNETGMFDLEQELRSEKFRPFIGDIRDKDRLKRSIENVDIVFHAAALKHVPLCEYNPFEAVKTNVLGTQNLIEVAMDEEVEKFITISTDKAVNPINVVGATKLLAERLTITANYYKGYRKTTFSCVRFGNVLDSRGSVVPIFEKQIRMGGPVTITDPRMTRFVMSIPQAVELILKTAEIARGEDIFTLKMPALRIVDLAEAMIEDLAPKYGYKPEAIKTKIVGKRPGEKLHEELLTEDEVKFAIEKDGFFVLNLSNSLREGEQITRYTSDDVEKLNKDQIKKLLNSY